MALSGLQILARSRPCRLRACPTIQLGHLRLQSSSSAAAAPQNGNIPDKEEESLPAAPSPSVTLVPTDPENAPDVYVTQQGEVYDQERLARDVSRMYPHHRAKMLHVGQMPQIMFEFQEGKDYKRKLYARYGRASGVNPGWMWPSREEIGRMTGMERDLGIPTLQESWDRVREKREAQEKANRLRYDRVEANMKKMEADIKAFRQRQRQAEEAVQAEKAKRQKVLEEAKDLLGFKVDPRDKRFQELLEAKEAAMKKEAKLAKKKEKEAKSLARLTSLENSGSTEASGPA
ncbi:hypothetical protein BV898_12800 [Hypsibius exemplaris]|uniref:Large ribosomal subunit protein mL64 n=1 Tax=Hypsibius exemplaris TaxID=2072580 RepID=A0A1W0WCM5_HYPEX|nr:hypothetical protein BV898_12800 [Hypsibius exemplaris]